MGLEYLLGVWASAAIGVMLALACAACAWRGRGRAVRGWLAAYFGTVGAGFVLDALTWLPPGDTVLRSHTLHRVLLVLDPALLVGFALAVTRARVPRAAYALVALPALALAAWVPFLGPHLQGQPTPLPFRLALVAEMALAYGGAYLLVQHAVLRERCAPEQARSLLLLVGLVTLPRLALLSADYVGHLRDGTIAAALCATLAAAIVVCLAPAWPALRRPTTPGHHALRRSLRTLLVLFAPLVLLWAGLSIEAFRSTLRPLTYSARWLLILAVLGHGFAAGHLAAVRPRAQPVVQAAVGVLLAGLAVLVIAGALSRGTPLGVGAAFGWAAGAVLLVLVLQLSLRWALPSAAGGHAAATLRARVAAEGPDADPAALGARMGIGAAEAEALWAPTTTWPETGRSFRGAYHVLGPLARGAGGAVLLAYDLRRDRSVVLKELRPDGPGGRAATAREVRGLLAARHPGLVRLLDVERVEEGAVLVLEHVRGPSLRQRIESGDLTPREVRAVARRVLAALAALHAAGCAHGDVKPENIVLREGRDPVLVDLGAARPARGAFATLPDGAACTPAYAAPEASAGASPQGDVYAAAVVLWECLAGRRPPEGDVSEAWRGVLLLALAKDPAQRPQDAAALAALLPGRARAGGVRVGAAPAGVGEAA